MNITIFDIKRFAVHDGPGIRTTVFFKGCPLNCWWCHNPESRSGFCQNYEKTVKLDEKSYVTTEQVGKIISMKDLMDEIKKDHIFFDESKGGVTFSGGEPLLQAKALKLLAAECKKEEIHTALDTTGYATEEVFREACTDIDLFLYDIKHLNDAVHKKYTGVSNAPILKNLDYLSKTNKKVYLRFPVIPGVNDDKKHVHLMDNLLRKLISDNIKNIDLLPYHKIGSDKYQRFGIESHNTLFQEPGIELLNQIKIQFEKTGFDVKIGG